MKVAVLYICTGRYNQFFSGFYESAEKYLLKGIADVEYFVWTDNINLCSASNVHIIERQCQGFPKDSLFRFDMFLSIKEKLLDFDYVFFFNANQLLLAPVGEEILPVEERLVAVLHPVFSRKWLLPCTYPYERNKKSTAYISPYGKNYHYFMGSFNGGKSADFIELAEVCSRNTHIDWDNNIVAMVHDESHLNRYMRDHICKIVPSTYAYPEEWGVIKKDVKMMLRDKTRLDAYFNKGRNKKMWGRFMQIIKTLHQSICWYI